MTGKFHDGGFVPKRTYTMDGREWTLEELARCSPELTRQAEEAIRRAALERQRQRDEEMWRDLVGRARPFVSDPPWGAPPRRNAVEVITDPSDRRGFDARRVGP